MLLKGVKFAMKKLFSLILFLMLGISLCSCKNEEKIKYDEYSKIASNLYEVTCNEYDYDYLFENGVGNRDFLGGCSAIRIGDYLGRNFDFVAGDAAEIVVKTPASKDHYASIAITGGLMWLTSEFMDKGLDKDAKKLIPILLLDGINEKGVVVEINCVNASDVGGITQHTNIGKKQVPQLAVVRYLLDKASSADEAIEIMKSIDIVNSRDVMGLVGYGLEIHFLIADKDKTYVVEFNNTKKDGEKLIVLENGNILTNFYLHMSDVENNVFTDHSTGVERYRKLKDNKDSVNSLETMKELMQSIRYSNGYKLTEEYSPGENYDNPYTCFSDHPLLGEEEINYGNYKNHVPELLEAMEKEGKEVANILKDPKLVNPNNLWVTSHNSVYDIKSKTMSIAVYERYEKYYDYSLK